MQANKRRIEPTFLVGCASILWWACPPPLRYVGVPSASRLGRARTPHEGMPPGMWAPDPAGR
jgi:hypothetical protein